MVAILVQKKKPLQSSSSHLKQLHICHIGNIGNWYHNICTPRGSRFEIQDSRNPVYFSYLLASACFCLLHSASPSVWYLICLVDMSGWWYVCLVCLVCLPDHPLVVHCISRNQSTETFYSYATSQNSTSIGCACSCDGAPLPFPLLDRQGQGV